MREKFVVKRPWDDFSDVYPQIREFIEPLIDWSGKFGPSHTDRARIRSAASWIEHEGILVCTRMEFSLLTLRAAEENKKFSRNGEKLRPESELIRLARSQAPNFNSSPQQICRPILVTSFDDVLSEEVSYSAGTDVIRFVVASLMATVPFALARRWLVPNCIRDVAYSVALIGCIGIITDDWILHQRMEGMRDLLVDSIWPIARDYDGHLIILAESAD